MTMPKDGGKDKLMEESVNEANAINEGIEGLDLDAARVASADAAASGAQAAEGDAALSSVKPEGTSDNQGSKANLEAIDWEKVGKIYKPESAIEEIVQREMNRLAKGFD